MNEAKWGAQYRLHEGKGCGEFRWCVTRKDGTEVVAGTSYSQALEAFERSEAAAKAGPCKRRATLNTRAIEFDWDEKAEYRERRKKGLC